MRTPPRMPYKELRQAITKDVDKYFREVRRIRRAEMRAFITHRCETDGSPVPTSDEIEIYVDILEALIQVAGYDRDNINQLIDELAWSPEGKLSSDQILLSLEERIARATPQVTDDTILDQYHFTVTGRISTRCQSCRRGRRWTEHEFMHPVTLRRMLLYPATCPWCYTGHVKVYGVRAVRRDSMPLSQGNQPETRALEMVTTAEGLVYAVAPAVRERQRAKTKGNRWSKKR